jgi:hypothetical protein
MEPDDLQSRLAALAWHPTREDMMRGCHALRRGVLIETGDIEA